MRVKLLGINWSRPVLYMCSKSWSFSSLPMFTVLLAWNYYIAWSSNSPWQRNLSWRYLLRVLLKFTESLQKRGHESTQTSYIVCLNLFYGLRYINKSLRNFCFVKLSFRLWTKKSLNSSPLDLHMTSYIHFRHTNFDTNQINQGSKLSEMLACQVECSAVFRMFLFFQSEFKIRRHWIFLSSFWDR